MPIWNPSTYPLPNPPNPDQLPLPGIDPQPVEWYHKERARKSLRRRLRRHPRGLCARCGKPATEWHHKNQDVFDNSRANLEPLCESCHHTHHHPNNQQ